jgi:nitroimidazol reductase NimA-like FMN-containing flavoprotein (pyridoxamine 5'-phosphate oxidase superfamily)
VVPVRLACHRPDGGLWMLSLWYRREGESLQCATGAGADVVEYLRADGAVAFEVSTNTPPYMGVRGNGTATVEPDGEKTVIRALVERYLGGTESSMAQHLLAEDREEVRVTVEPERLYTWDFSERMRATSGGTPAAAGDPESPRGE